jgi:hypothetical protein
LDRPGGTAILRTLILAVAALTLGACSADSILARYESLPETQIARESIELLRTKNYDALRTRLAPEQRDDPKIARGMPIVAGQFPDGEPIGIKLIDYQFTTFSPFNGSASTNYSIAFEYEYPEIWIVTIAALRRANEETSVTGINAFRNLQSLENLNALTFENKSALHFVMVLLAVVVFGFIVATLITAIRTKIPKRKWLWIIFIIIGIGQISLNWTTGELSFAANFNLFAVGMVRRGLGPWILQIGIPLGAALFWWRRRAWVERSPADQFA